MRRPVSRGMRYAPNARIALLTFSQLFGTAVLRRVLAASASITPQRIPVTGRSPQIAFDSVRQVPAGDLGDRAREMSSVNRLSRKLSRNGVLRSWPDCYREVGISSGNQALTRCVSRCISGETSHNQTSGPNNFRLARRTPTKDVAPAEGRALRLLVFPFVQICVGGRPIRHHRCVVLRGLKPRVLGITKTTGTSHSEFTARTPLDSPYPGAIVPGYGVFS
jgi:hypothetical protein